jgi:hypothetical protein
VPRRSFTALLICLAATAGGSAFGAITNSINGQVSRDYFAITLSCDWAAAPAMAIERGAVEGAVIGLFYGVFLTVAVAASTRMRYPVWLTMRALAWSLGVVLACWVVGGVGGTILAEVKPSLWGFVFAGVPPRVSLPRFAWVGGSIVGAYVGTAVSFVIATVRVHLRWKRMGPPVHAFEVVGSQE